MSNTLRETFLERYKKLCNSANSDVEDFILLLQDAFIELERLEKEIKEAEELGVQRGREEMRKELEKHVDFFIHEMANVPSDIEMSDCMIILKQLNAHNYAEALGMRAVLNSISSLKILGKKI